MTCETCQGRGVIPSERLWSLCPACSGGGTVQETPRAAPPGARVASEAAIQGECCQLLIEDGWRVLVTDPVSDKSRGKGFGEVGMADVLFLRPMLPTEERAGMPRPWAQVLWCEFKTGREKARKNQISWHIAERARGFLTWIANEDFPATVEGFREHYAKSGLMRRTKWWPA